MRRRQEREPIQVVLVVNLGALREARRRVTRHDQADKDGVHVDLIAIRCCSAAKTPAVRERRINRGVERNDVPREAVSNRDRPAQVDGRDDVETRTLERGHLVSRNAERLVDAERVGVSHQNGIEDVSAEVGDVAERWLMQILRLALCPHQAGVEERQRIAADLHVRSQSADAGDDIAAVDHLEASTR